jgi:uncharacterized protein (TIGR00297 family)
MTETIFLSDINVARAIAGFVLAVIVAGAAWRLGSLNGRGFIAATACGTACAIAGWSWAILLVLYFMAASALSRGGKREKEALMQSVVAKGGNRDAWQVMANGGVYSAAALLSAFFPSGYLQWGAIGALAAASADTWATEIGVLLGGQPKSIVTRTVVRTGESGGVTWPGTLGSLAGSAWIGLGGMLVSFPRGVAIASLVAGFLGSVTDSVLGATIQERRHCDDCDEATERAVHLCGATTRRAGGIRGADNDVINLLSTIVGFLLGVIVYFLSKNFGTWGAIG